MHEIFEYLKCLLVFSASLLCSWWLIMHRVTSAQLIAPKEINTTRGGSVMVSCMYDREFRENSTYWCRGPVYELCIIVVKTSRNRQNDRVFITDDKEAGVFHVTMTLLKESDENMYWCVISKSGRDIHTGVRLHISHTGMHLLRHNALSLTCRAH